MSNGDDYPHVCPSCKKPAYLGGNQTVDCSNKRCHLHVRFRGQSISTKKLVDKIYELKDEIFRTRRDPRAMVARDALDLVVNELLGGER